jgi:hypothetical protein
MTAVTTHVFTVKLHVMWFEAWVMPHSLNAHSVSTSAITVLGSHCFICRNNMVITL